MARSYDVYVNDWRGGYASIWMLPLSIPFRINEAIIIDADPLRMIYAYSLHVDEAIVIESEMEASAKKAIQAENDIVNDSSMDTAKQSVIQGESQIIIDPILDDLSKGKSLPVDDIDIVVDSAGNFLRGRLRQLYEMDDYALNAYDDMPLIEVYYTLIDFDDGAP